MNGPRLPASAAQDVADLVRYLAAATRRGDSLPEPADLAVVVGHLHDAVTQLPQVLTQLARHADRYGTWSDLYDYRDGDPAAAVRDLVMQLRVAASTVTIAAEHLAAAHEAASRLGTNEGETR